MTLLLRISCFIVGISFLASAFFKLLAPEGFYMEIFSLTKHVNLTNFIAASLIFIEFFLGFLLVFQIVGKKKWVLKLVILLLLAFTIYLLPKVLAGETENCQCFGDYIEMSPLQSIFKNGVLLLICSFLLIKWNCAPILQNIKKIIFIFAVLIPTGLIFAFQASSHQGIEKINPSEQLNLELTKLGKETGQNFLLKKKQLVLFFKATCSHCASTAKQYKKIQKTSNAFRALVFISGSEKEIVAFVKETSIPKANAFMLNEIDFRNRLSDPILPVMYLCENEKTKFRVYEFTPQTIETILNFI
jgi:hypothetical protein